MFTFRHPSANQLQHDFLGTPSHALCEVTPSGIGLPCADAPNAPGVIGHTQRSTAGVSWCSAQTSQHTSVNVQTGRKLASLPSAIEEPACKQKQ